MRYLLDRDVLSQLDQPEEVRHQNVRRWFESIPDNTLHVGAITIMEGWKGLASIRRRSAGQPERLHECDLYEHAFAKLVGAFSGRIVSVDAQVARLWGELIGQQDKNRFDVCLAAMAIVHDLVIATRNVRDFTARRVSVVDPFRTRPIISPPSG